MTPKKKRNGPLPLSRLQYGALVYIDTHSVTEDHLRQYRDTTMYWLLKRGYFILTLSGEMLLTPEGSEALDSYKHADMPMRQSDADITERTRIELSAARTRAKKLKAIA
jgi:hypothetical protein